MKSLPAVALLLLLAGTLAAAPPTDPELKVVGQVNKSIDDGVQFLRKTRDPKQHWESYWIEKLTGMDGGITALATLALMNCGVRTDDPAVAEPLEYLRKLPPQKTYVVALVTICLVEAKNAKDLPTIQNNVKWLLETAIYRDKNLEGWSYPAGELPRADASNTQYALLGLYAAKQAGAEIPNETWKAIQKLYLSSATVKGDQASWSYVPGGGQFGGASFTMTVAGVCGLYIARMGLDDSQQQLDPKTGIAAKCGVYADAEVLRKGLNWVGNKFSFDAAEGAKSLYYNVYGIERVGRLSGERFLGRADWYREGCEFLVKGQRADGSWAAQNDTNFRGVHVISTAFSLLFLSKGRSPVLISKMAFGDFVMDKRILTEKSSNPDIIGWNRKQSDAKNLTEFASRELFKNAPLGWQTYDPRRREFGTEKEILEEAGQLVESPILYITGHEAPRFTDQQKQLLKKYLQEGGFVIAEACCGSKEFAEGLKDVLQEKSMFPDNDIRPLPAVHAIWKSHFLVSPKEFPKIECLDVGCRTVMILSSEPLAGFWDERKFMPKPGKDAANRGELAFQFAANTIAYATGKELPKQRLAKRPLQSDGKDDKAPKSGFLEPVQLRLDEAAPAMNALRNMAGFLRDNAKLDIVVQKLDPKKNYLAPTDDDLFKYKFLYMHGKKEFEFDEAARDNVKAVLQSGGLLLADPCCGSEAFDKSFRAMVEKLFPEAKLEAIPTDDLLFSAKLNRTAIESVERREKVGNAAETKDAGYEKLPPKLEGIKIDGRWVVIYSRYDLGCAMEGHKSTDCLGHTPESAKKLAAAAVLYSLKR